MVGRLDKEKIDRWCERIILALFLAIVVFGPLAFGAVRAREYVVIQWLSVAIVGVWLVRLWIAPKFRFLLPPTLWAVLPFIGYAIWRYRVADVEYAARQEFVHVLVCGVLFLAFVNNLYTQESVRTVSITLVTLGMLISMYGIYQWLAHSNRVWGVPDTGYEGRGSGTYICPNHLAGFLEMILPMAVALVVMGRFSALWRIGLAYAAFVMLMGIAGTRSRAGWFAAGAAMFIMAFMLLQTRRQLWAALAIMVVVIGTGMVLYPRVLKPRMKSHPDAKITGDIRFRFWSSAWAMWKDHPWVGVGPNHFDIRYRKYRKEHWQMFMRPGHAHNDYLNTLVDWGAVGFALVLAPLGVATYGLVRAWRFLRRGGGEFRQKGGNRLGYVLGAAIGLLAILFHSFFDFNLHIPANAIVAMTLLALLTTHWRFATERYWFTARWPFKIVATLVLATAGGYLGMTATTKTKEASALSRADRLESSVDKIAALQRAFAVDPRNYETTYAIGEELRLLSWNGGSGHEQQAREAIDWFKKTITLNPWDVHSYLRCGMSFDWISAHGEAAPYFDKAIELDPNHYFVRAMRGWHAFQVEDYKGTIEWMNHSLKLNGSTNPLAYTYLDFATKRMANAQTP